MPANLTPDYFKAEQWYREATTTEEKILALEQMLAVMPKHKGTDHLKADIRRKLSKLRDSSQKKKSSQIDIFHVPKMGAGQIVLIGTPNCGKSSILAMLTNAKVQVADFPFATGVPVPGMMTFEDVQIQLVDMPPITADFVAPGQVGTYRNCDLIAIVVDLSADIEEQLKACLNFLEARNLLQDEQTQEHDEHGNMPGKRAIRICTKKDIAQQDALESFKTSSENRFETITVSAIDSEQAKELSEFLFKQLHIVRVYAKPPGQKVDTSDPFTLAVGSTVLDLAQTIHRELADKLKHARIWGTGVYDGQNVHKTHVLNDKDVVELHFG